MSTTASSARSGGGDVAAAFTSACHDLRQPLAAIQVLVAAAFAQRAEPDAVERRLEQILEQTLWLSDLLDSFERADEPEQVLDLYPLAEMCSTRAAQGEGGCRVRLRGDASAPVQVIAPAVGMQRVLGNVLDNAVRAAGPRGEVLVTVERRGDAAVVEVADDGPGFGLVPAGTRVGLAWTRSFLAEHRGRLEVGTAESGGALVRVWLPTSGSRPA